MVHPRVLPVSWHLLFLLENLLVEFLLSGQTAPLSVNIASSGIFLEYHRFCQNIHLGVSSDNC